MSKVTVTSERNKTVVVGLIRGRHEMPVNDYIFNDSIEDVFDMATINQTISDFVENEVGVYNHYGIALNQNDYTDIECFRGSKNLVVYVTGLTLVTAELIKVCAYNGIPLTLMHYNSVTNEYVAQIIFD